METQNTTTTTQTTNVPLYSRVKAATLDTQTGEVHLTEGVDAKWLIQDLVREIQMLQAQLEHYKKAETKTENTTTETLGEKL